MLCLGLPLHCSFGDQEQICTCDCLLLKSMPQWGFPCGSSDKGYACHCLQAGDSRFSPWVRLSFPSTLASEIPWTEVSGRLQSTGTQRTGHNLSTDGLSQPLWDPLFPADGQIPCKVSMTRPAGFWMQSPGDQVQSLGRFQLSVCTSISPGRVPPGSWSFLAFPESRCSMGST